jgi:ankyrin repeat protein
MTCLHYAARLGLKQITVLLMTSGVDVNLRDECGFNASYWAHVNKHQDVMNLLPPPKTISADDYLEYKQQLQEIHKINLPSKKKKKKKK